MPTLEQLCKRIFSDSGWMLKCLLGGILMIVPILQFFALGFLYRQAEEARRGSSVDLADWDEWTTLFLNGIRMFGLIAGLGVLPILLAWLLSLPMRPVLGPLAYLPLIPAFVAAPLLTAAGLYLFQRRERFTDAFYPRALVAMLVADSGTLVLPALALLGLLFVGFPLFPFAFFAGLVAFLPYSALRFRQLEVAAQRTPV
jgi:hypothetical protein